MTTVVAVRHGETAWSRERRIQGWAPTPLTESGRAQAGRIGETLAAEYDVDRVVSSDLHRATETTDEILEHVDAPLTTESAWRERDFGVFQGLPADEWLARFPEYELDGPDVPRKRPDSGESLVDVRERVVDGWERLLANSEPTETIVVVAHGGPIRLILGHLKDLSIVEAITEQSQTYCSINEFRHDHGTDGTTVVRENDADHR
ncbi:histidine phosphatase family protein [Halobium palmae]|uniref:Histidine phosphatase family protein n=1 Tax=Halobium palmae TaxID=1776492 RepID=A0ABD5S261_9EURY